METSYKGGNMTTCFLIPPKVNSPGILASGNLTKILTYTMPHLELQLALIFTISYSIHYFLKRVGASLFVSCLLAGLILGPTCLGRYETMRKVLFNHESQDMINTAARFGFSMFLFLSAVKMDAGMILKTGHKALSIGILGMVVPLAFSVVYEKLYRDDFPEENERIANLRAMVIQSFTSFPVIACLVGEQLKITNSELGRLGLSSALVADTLGNFGTIVLSLVKRTNLFFAIKNGIPLLIYFLVLVFIIRPAMLWVIRRTPERKPINTSFIHLTVALAIASEVYFHFVDQMQFLGPFFFGLAVPAGAPLGSALVEKFSPFSIGVLLNLLVTTSMMRADLWLIISQITKLKTFTTAILSINAVKLLAFLTPSLFAGMPLIDSVALSLIMSYKGVVDLAVADVFRDTQTMNEEVFALTAFSILCNATIVPILVKLLYDPSRKYAGYQSRNISSLKPNSELRILACIHRPDNVDSVIKLIDVCHPTKESPISIFALHLIKLVGRSTPVLLCHQKQKPVSNSSSQQVIHAFNLYEQTKWDTVSVQTFTAISSSQLMHEDICTLALDKRTPLILVPLHRTWSIHGTIDSEDQNLRALNCKVLEKAPCSVGIFFDRGRLGRRSVKASSHVSVVSLCMIFFGGGDDREALSLAKRMVRSSNASLTVIHFVANDNKTKSSTEDKMLDDEELEGLKQISARNESVVYRKYEVNNGPETVLIIRSFANLYDLFLLGRRFGIVSAHTTGLSEWSELPELGIFGDFFASKDLKTRASVFVVQKQKQINRLR
ncbi:hypothetical protein P3X46_000144 [Hevea brasiliensis]|uniref:Cation/H+ exchanger domain-containing protein n=1 Tax=Hevea brasiliensis TaxID=3981 RepID=A0ABQ9NAG5_HEVBR|nr:cation/H(+) antiporter 4-like [Hevea brasiliensis]KAJ9188780.1 hypothetical protein P3X46_000144 [Hevea brasiliensis]